MDLKTSLTYLSLGLALGGVLSESEGLLHGLFSAQTTTTYTNHFDLTEVKREHGPEREAYAHQTIFSGGQVQSTST